MIEVQRGRGANHTPLVVGTRDVDDAEDFRFASTVSPSTYPTSGFFRVATVRDLDRAFEVSTWGSVILVVNDINLDDLDERELKSGVTLRGNRKGMVDGPQINRRNGAAGKGDFIWVNGDDARVTGLRLRGPTTSDSDSVPEVVAINSDTSHRVLVDHNEISAWTEAAVRSDGPDQDAPQ